MVPVALNWEYGLPGVPTRVDNYEDRVTAAGGNITWTSAHRGERDHHLLTIFS